MKIKMQLSGQSVILQVPEGVDPQAYASQVEERHSQQEGYSAASDSGLENFAAGMGRGATNVGRQVGNVLGFVDDETIQAANARDAELLSTKAGLGGNIVGELAATALPAAKLASMAAKSAQTVQGGGRLAQAVKQGVANPTGKLALENAAVGSLLAGPGNRGTGAAQGAAISGTLSGIGNVGKRLFTKPWAQKSADALDLEQQIGTNIPLSQSGEEGLWKQIYGGLVANMPGAGGKFRQQFDDSLAYFRDHVAKGATPPGFSWASEVGDTMQTVFKNLEKAWGDAFEFDFLKAPIVLFKDSFKKPKWWDSAKPDGAPSLKVGDEATGETMVTLKRDIQNTIDNLDSATDWRKVNELTEFRNSVDKVLKRNLNPSGKGTSKWATELEEYEALAVPYRKWKDLQKAGKAAAGDAAQFTPKQLQAATSSRAGKAGLTGEAPYSEISKLGTDVLEDFPSRQGIFQSGAALGLVAPAAGAAVGGLAGGWEGAVLGLAGPIAGAKILAHPNVQRALAGQLPKQQVAAAVLRAHKEIIEQGGRLASKAAVVSSQQ